MTTLLPKDDNGYPIPALCLVDEGAHSIAVSATSARNTTAFNAATKVISIYATSDVFIKLGTAAVTATASDHFFPKETYYDLALGINTHLAAIKSATDGTVYISEKE